MDSIVKLKTKDIFLKGNSFHLASTTFKSGENYGLHTHDFYEFVIVKEGRLKQAVNSKSEVLEKYTLCLIKPDDIHSISNQSKSEVKINNFAVTIGAINKASKFLGIEFQKDVLQKVKIPIEDWNYILHKISELQTMQHSKEQQFIDLFVDNLIVNLLTILVSKNEVDEKSIPLWLRNSYKEMYEEKNILVGLPRFIELSQKSQEHLNRSMKKYYATTPTAFINLLRLQFATQLLTSTDKSIISIIYDSGFENVSHFSKLFKKQFGVTPRIYRRRNKMVYNPK
ncbi:MAG: helix-turn-helix domain-containing protein [Melioribacteraceae bacterium]